MRAVILAFAVIAFTESVSLFNRPYWSPSSFTQTADEPLLRQQRSFPDFLAPRPVRYPRTGGAILLGKRGDFQADWIQE